MFQPAQCAHWRDAGGNLHVVAEAQRLGSGPDAAIYTQILHIEMFWRPYPGKTPSNRTATDATLRYVVSTPHGAAEYTGTGFVWTKQPRFGGLRVGLERAELRLSARTGTIEDVLGEVRLSGVLYPAADQSRAVALLREADIALSAAPEVASGQ